MGIALTCMSYENERSVVLELEYRHFLFLRYFLLGFQPVLVVWYALFCFGWSILDCPVFSDVSCQLGINLAFSMLWLHVQRRSNRYMYHFCSLCFDPTWDLTKYLSRTQQPQYPSPTPLMYFVLQSNIPMLMQIYSQDYECTWSRFSQTRAVSTNLDIYVCYYCYMYVNTVKNIININYDLTY